jgi:Fic family protein
VASALSDLETHLHQHDPLPALLRVGLAHAQFETIHPFLDGNGRLGRLLITLLLEHWGLLAQPLLYLSLFFRRHRAEYYRRLAAVRTEGDWEGWLAFFLEGVTTVADESVSTARELFSLVSGDRVRLLAQDSATVTSVRLFELLPRHPVITIPSAAKLLDTSRPTASKAVAVLERTGILNEATGQRRDRRYHYVQYIEVLRVGTDLPDEGRSR